MGFKKPLEESFSGAGWPRGANGAERSGREVSSRAGSQVGGSETVEMTQPVTKRASPGYLPSQTCDCCPSPCAVEEEPGPAPVRSKLFSARGRSVVAVLKLREPPKEAGAAGVAGEPERLLPPSRALCRGGRSCVSTSALQCLPLAPTPKGRSAKTQLGQPASVSSCGRR